MNKLTEVAYRQLIDEDIIWLSRFENTLERQHIETVLRSSVPMYYPPYRDELDPIEVDDGLHFNCHNMYVKEESE